MLKRPITYTDFDENTVTEIFYFNLSKAEIVRLEVSYKEGLQEALMKIVKSENNELILEEFEKIIRRSYGIKSEDGKRFVKSEELSNQFTQTAAYDALFMELVTDATAAADFIRGIIPKDVAGQMQDKDKPIGPPPKIAGGPPLPPGTT